MKKLFLVFTLIASVATSFMGCRKTTNDSDIYTIDMTGLTIDGISGTPALHYVGTMPKFDFPFSD